MRISPPPDLLAQHTHHAHARADKNEEETALVALTRIEWRGGRRMGRDVPDRRWRRRRRRRAEAMCHVRRVGAALRRQIERDTPRREHPLASGFLSNPTAGPKPVHRTVSRCFPVFLDGQGISKISNLPRILELSSMPRVGCSLYVV